MSEAAMVEHKSLYAYLTTLPSTLLENLYRHPNPSLCMAIFRDLSPMAQKFVLRQLFIDQILPKSVFLSWISPEGKKDHDDAVRLLNDLKIWSEAPSSAGLMGWKLNEHFRKGVQAVVVGGGPSWSGDDQPTAEETSPRDVPFLEKYARERWEVVLHYLAGLDGSNQISKDTIAVLAIAGLIKESGSKDSGITQNGFRFLLMDTPSQVWRFILAYLFAVEKWGMNLIECISFIFQLSFSQMGKHYSSVGFSSNQQKTLQHFREFGLIYMRSSKKSSRFYPTNLVINLSAGAGLNSAAFNEGYIIVETNYRIMVYTDSPLKIAIVSYFSDMLYRFPNLALGMITRESIRRALVKGISTDEIIRFLRSHAHPQMKESNPILPNTLTDQIKLWEMERERCVFSDGVLYNNFLSQKDFEMLRNYASDLGVAMCSNAANKVVVVSPEGHDQVRAFWKRQKKD